MRHFSAGSRLIACLFAATIALATTPFAIAQSISTVAGNGTAGSTGDNGPGTSASLNPPTGLALDAAGNLYISDSSGGNRVRKLTPGGTITTVAGNGSSTSSGDGGAATSAGVDRPFGLAIDSAGNLYIAETWSHRVRKVASNGTITTVAGSSAAAGTLAGDGGPATSAGLNFPYDVAVDGSGNLYIADAGNNRIRKVAPDGTITTVAGAGFSQAFGGDGGPATSAYLAFPQSVEVDTSGNVFVADTGNQRIRKFAPGGVITTVVGNGGSGPYGDGGPALSATLHNPISVAVDASGRIYITNEYSDRVRMVGLDNIIDVVAGNGATGFSGDGGPALSASLYRPRAIVTGPGGIFYIADQFNCRVRKVAPTPPSAPAIGSAIAGHQSATVSFSTPLANGGAAITGYTVVSSPAGGLDSNAGSMSLFHTMTGLTNGTPYTFTVTASNSAGSSAPSSPSNSVTPSATPSPPRSLVATAGAAQASVAFLAPSNLGASAILGYTVTSNPAGGIDSHAGSLSLAHTITGLANGTAYTFTATATNPNGTSEASLASNSVTPLSVPGAPVIGLATQHPEASGYGSVSVEFSPPSDTGGLPIQGYVVASSPAGGTDSSCCTPASPHVVTGLTFGVDYTFSVKAINSLGTGPSSAASNPVRLAVVPLPPNIVSATAGNATATVTFSAPQSDGGSAITGYTVTSTGNHVDMDAGTNKLSHSITGMTNGTAYTFIVYATNVAGTSSPSQPSNVVFPIGPPTAPGAPTATAGHGQATVTFPFETNNGGELATYVVTSSPAGGVDSQAGSFTRTRVLTGLTNGVSHTFSVVASNSAGSSPPSVASNAVIPLPPAAPGAPLIGFAYAGNASASVSFYPPVSDGGSAITGYTVSSTPAGGIDSNAGSVSLNHLMTGLANETAYTFSVRATNALGTGSASAQSNSVTPSATIVEGSLSTVVGGFLGDAGAATQAMLSSPEDVAIDAGGNVYIADRGNHRIRKVTPGGTITTFAGNGLSGFSGDGGQATSARLYLPSGVALDSVGNLYISDSGNHRIRKVATSGIISTVAGTGAAASSGDAGPALAASFYEPRGIAIDAAGNVLVSEWQGHRIRKFAVGGMISTYAGTGSPGFSGDQGAAILAQLNRPSGISMDASGNLFIADSYNQRIRRISAAGVIETVAGSGAADCNFLTYAKQSDLFYPDNVEVDTLGNFYIADGCDSVDKVDVNGFISPVAGTQLPGFSGDGVPGTTTRIYSPGGMAFDDAGNLLFADFNNQRVRKLAPDGVLTTFAGSAYSGDGGNALGAGLSQPAGMGYDGQGNLYIVERAQQRIRKVSPAGIISTVAGSGITGFCGDGGPAVNACLFNPSAIVVRADGSFIFADRFNNRVRFVSNFGVISTVAGNGIAGSTGDGGSSRNASLFLPDALALDSSGNLYIASLHQIRRVDPTGVITTVVGTGAAGFSGDGGPATLAKLNRPSGLAIKATGLYVSDTNNHRIRRVSGGVITTVAGNGTPAYAGDGGAATTASINAPRGLIVDGSGNIYFSDVSNRRIRKVSAAGVISTVAGVGEDGFSGESGPALDAKLALPHTVALGPTGDLMVSDYSNNRVRRVLLNHAAAPPAPPAPTATAGVAQASISISPPSSDGGAPISGYVVTSSPAGGVDSNAGSAAATHVVTGLANGTAYTFTVQASNSVGQSPPSAASNSVTPMAQALSVNDVTVVEGNAGTKQANFTVSLSQASADSVGFDIGTAPGTAAPGVDYIESSLVGQSIPAGQTTANFSVTINGDTSVEDNETFTVNLSNVTGALAVDGQGLGRIDNDDDAGLSIADVVVMEGDGEPRTAQFVVTLASPMPTPVTFDIGTSNGSASAGSDYVARNQVGKVLDAGRTRAVFEVSVLGDATPEPDETFNVAISNVSGALVADGTAVATIQNDDAALLPISSIQGSGVVSPLLGNVVSTSGVVTALTDSGFFIQSEVGQEDGDRTTSEGIFIASDDDGARVGDRVRVRGRVDEAQIGRDPNQLTLTQLLASEVNGLGRGHALPSAVAISASEAGANLPVTGLERLEGMRVSIPEMRVVGPAGGTVDEHTGAVRANGRFYGVAKGVARPFREPGMSVLDRARAHAGADLPLFDSNPERLLVNSLGQRGSVAVSVDTGDTILGLVGVLAYGDGAYQVLPDSSTSLAVRSGAEPRAVAARGAQQATIGSFHLRRFLDDQAGSNEPVVGASAYAIRLAKAANAICAYARSPDVVAVSGIEGKVALTDLADALNSRDGNLLFPESCSGDASYRAVLHSTLGKVGSGFLVRDAKVRSGLPRIELKSVSAAGNNETFLNRDGTREPLHDVVPSLLQARINDASAAPVEITLMAVAITALEGDLSAQGAHGWLTQGQYLRAKRSAQAMSLGRIIQARQRTRPQEKLVVLGNLESNEFSDGHADLLGVISGREAVPRRELRPAASPVNPPLTNLTLGVPRADRYTVSRDGNAEAVDHVLVSRALMQPAFKARMEIAHIDADFGEDNFSDAGVPVRVSDHDPVVLFLDLPSSP